MQNDDAPMITLLKSSGAKRPIHLLAYYGDTDGAETRELTEFLFAADMNPGHRDGQGSTLLHEQAHDDEELATSLAWAQRRGHDGVASWLLKANRS